MNSTRPKLSTEVGVLQIAILLLSLLLLLALALDTLVKLPREVQTIIQMADTTICGILLTDFLVRLYRTESKLSFLKWGWIDLVASIPNLDVLRWGRMVRVLRVIRLLRGIRSLQRILRMILAKRLESGAVSLALAAFLLAMFSSISVLVVEREPESNIKSAEDAIWWSIATMTTVGYGDRYPVTTEGRIIGIVLMVSGVGMFAGLSGLVASLFLGGPEKNSSEMTEILAKLEQIQMQLNSQGNTRDMPDREEPR